MLAPVSLARLERAQVYQRRMGRGRSEGRVYRRGDRVGSQARGFHLEVHDCDVFAASMPKVPQIIVTRLLGSSTCYNVTLNR